MFVVVVFAVAEGTIYHLLSSALALVLRLLLRGQLDGLGRKGAAMLHPLHFHLRLPS